MTHLGSVNDQAARAEKAERELAAVSSAKEYIQAERGWLRGRITFLEGYSDGASDRAEKAERERDDALTSAACEGDIADTFKRERDEAQGTNIVCHACGKTISESDPSVRLNEWRWHGRCSPQVKEGEIRIEALERERDEALVARQEALGERDSRLEYTTAYKASWQDELRDWRLRLEKAEATIERVKALAKRAKGRGGPITYDKLEAALEA